MSAPNSNALRPTIGLFGAVTLAIGIVVGAGMLALPGLVYQQAGGWALWSWCLDAVIVAPLLVVFASLGRRFPSAGGVSGFVAEAFPGAAIGTSYLLLGTFALGIPAIALTGATYIVQGFGIDSVTAPMLTAAVGALLLATGLLATWAGAKVAGRLQDIVVMVLVGCLVLVALGAAPRWEAINFGAGSPSLSGVWSGAALAFFAFTGWEMLAFTAEEFKNPKRDFPIAVILSFLIVTGLYLGISAAVQALVPLDSPRLAGAPFLAVVESLAGGRAPGAAVAVLVTGIIVVNLNGACWAASRLLFDIGRRGWAPASLRLGAVNGSGTPRAAVGGITLMFGVVLIAQAMGIVSLETLLMTAGQNFFLLYLASVAVYVALGRDAVSRIFGGLAVVGCLVFAKAYGWGLAYAVIVFSIPYLAKGIIRRAQSISADTPTGT
ncbi:amino acid permease [Azospirillum cavernae]|uniref:Amino acid permease n=1 Tax=Azospirillum cavernae TaxID=2320860 RepID=A0A418W3E2_9PROT|nr:amino acid permease [Azospirillum cavernae]RJF84550.1 amino acid permease [Azospirillum cavernae]